MCDLFLVLAQTDEGVTCFVVPRVLPDGTRNAIRIQRLKDKLGNRSNASSEVEFDGAWARLVGEQGRGVPTIIEMVDHTRLDCVIGAAGRHARRRRPGDPPRAPPRGVRQAAGRPAADAQRAGRPGARVRGGDGRWRCAWRARTTRPRGRARAVQAPRPPRSASTGSASAARATPPRRWSAWAATATSRSRACRALYREAPLNSIWEGSGNVIALDVLRALARTPDGAGGVPGDEVDAGAPAPTRASTRRRRAARRARRPRGLRGARAPRSSSDLALALQASLLVRHAPAAVADAFCAAAWPATAGSPSARCPPASTSTRSSSAMPPRPGRSARGTLVRRCKHRAEVRSSSPGSSGSASAPAPAGSSCCS